MRYTPYRSGAYKPSEYVGWVTNSSNIIHIDDKFIRTDLEKMAARECDWNFCALHEMGHMFDFNQPWKFEAEVMTDATNQKKFEEFVAKLSLYGTKYYLSDQYKAVSIYTLKKMSAPTLSKSGTKVKVKWSNIAGETGYQISRSTSKTKTNIVATYKTTKGTYKLVSATKGKTYYYKVRAYKVVDGKKVYGPWSAVKSYKR